MSRSGYYAWLKQPISFREQSNRKLDSEIKLVYNQHQGKYGSPRITKDLNAAGITCSKHRVAKRMRLMQLRAKTKRKFKVTTDSKHDLPVSPNLLQRDFSASAINQKWVCDISYVRTDEGWVYLAIVLDLYSRKVIGWSMDKQMKKALVCNALLMALWCRKFPRDVIVHSDRGSQYCSHKYQKLLAGNGLRSSMSRRGDCWDNAVAESFFKTIKVEMIYQRRFSTREEAKTEIFKYIETYYNRVRRHSGLDYRTPNEVECQELAA